jgi:hypothetical protein
LAFFADQIDYCLVSVLSGFWPAGNGTRLRFLQEKPVCPTFSPFYAHFAPIFLPSLPYCAEFFTKINLFG